MYKQIVPFFMCFQTGPFHLVSSPLTTYNQQLWLTCVMQAENSKSKRPQIELLQFCVGVETAFSFSIICVTPRNTTVICAVSERFQAAL